MYASSLLLLLASVVLVSCDEGTWNEKVFRFPAGSDITPGPEAGVFECGFLNSSVFNDGFGLKNVYFTSDVYAFSRVYDIDKTSSEFTGAEVIVFLGWLEIFCLSLLYTLKHMLLTLLLPLWMLTICVRHWKRGLRVFWRVLLWISESDTEVIQSVFFVWMCKSCRRIPSRWISLILFFIFVDPVSAGRENEVICGGVFEAAVGAISMLGVGAGVLLEVTNKVCFQQC